jgi:hypothetical protein
MCSAFREAFPSPLRGGRTWAKPERGGGPGTEGAGVAARPRPLTALRPRDPHP